MKTAIIVTRRDPRNKLDIMFTIHHRQSHKISELSASNPRFVGRHHVPINTSKPQDKSPLKTHPYTRDPFHSSLPTNPIPRPLHSPLAERLTSPSLFSLVKGKQLALSFDFPRRLIARNRYSRISIFADFSKPAQPVLPRFSARMYVCVRISERSTPISEL